MEESQNGPEKDSSAKPSFSRNNAFARTGALLNSWYQEYEHFLRRRKWESTIGGLICNILATLACSGFLIFVNNGRRMLFRESVVITFWWVGLSIFLWRSLITFKRLGKHFPWGVYLMVLWFSMMAYWLYFPSTSSRFVHTENETTIKQFISDNSLDAGELVHKASFLFTEKEYAWSYVCYDTAFKTKRIQKLNEFYPYYIGDLLQIGLDQEAKNASIQMIADIESDFKNPITGLSTSRLLGQLIDNINVVRRNVPPEHKDFMKALDYQVNAYYQKSLTNKQPAP